MTQSYISGWSRLEEMDLTKSIPAGQKNFQYFKFETSTPKSVFLIIFKYRFEFYQSFKTANNFEHTYLHKILIYKIICVGTKSDKKRWFKGKKSSCIL